MRRPWDPDAQNIALKMLKEATSPKAVAKNLAADAEAKKKAELAADDEALGGKNTAEGRSDMANDRRAVTKERQDTYQKAMQQMQGRGKQGPDAPFQDDQVVGAMKQNIDNLLTASAQKGAMSKQLLTAVQNIANAAVNEAQDVSDMRTQINSLEQIVNGLLQPSQRNQAQNNSGR